MNQGMLFIGEAANTVETGIVVYFLTRCFPWKEKYTSPRVLSAILWILLFALSQLNGYFVYSHYLVILADIVLVFAFTGIFMQGDIHLKLLGCLFPFLTVSIINILVMQTLAVLNLQPAGKFMASYTSPFCIGAVLSKLLLWLMLSKVSAVIQDENLYLSKRYYAIINVLMASAMGIEFFLHYVSNTYLYDLAASRLMLAAAVGFALICLYIGYSIFRIGQQNSQLLRYELQQFKSRENERQIQEAERAGLRIRQLHHDYKNHCLNMQQLLDKKQYAELEDYLQKLTGRYLTQNQDCVDTHNAVLDAVINTKILECREAGIQFGCFVTGDVSEVTGLKLGIILFNLLDNAIEASREEACRKRIELRIEKDKDVLNITIKNDIVDSVLKDNPTLETNKPHKDLHGIGHLTVEEMVAEAQGMVEYYEEEDRFCVHVFLPVRNS